LSLCDTNKLASNLVEIRERLARSVSRVGRAVDDITVVAISKMFPTEAIRTAYELGLLHLCENRMPGWELKRAMADLGAAWHLIGHLHSNKCAVGCKRRNSLYEPGRRNGAWVKMRIGGGQEFVIGGYTPSPKNFDAVLVGYFEGNKLMFAARVRNGFVPACEPPYSENSKGSKAANARSLICRRAARGVGVKG
jgi:hypothetical protein